MLKRLPNHRAGRILWAIPVFLLAAGVILFLAAETYLLPSMRASVGADPAARRQLAAISALVLVVVLVLLLIVLLLVFRPGRMFLPRKSAPRTHTSYSDAWSESARRMQTPPPDEDPDEDKE